MKYIAVVELGDNDTAFGVSVPNVEGFFSAGDTFNEAVEQAELGLQSHIQLLLELGGTIPAPSDFDAHIDVDKNQVLVMINVDTDFDKKERVNISLPRHVLNYMDSEVISNPKYKDRSDFIAQTALEKRYA